MQSRRVRRCHEHVVDDYDNEDCEIVLDDSYSSDSHEGDLNIAEDEDGEEEDERSQLLAKRSPLKELPKPTDPSKAIRVALRLPCGDRTVHELDPDLQVEVSSLHSPYSFEVLRF